ncbi:Hsp20/alpha crystallin family [Verrucomicrobiia bacterium DG1235]|nr:Hsp20/alpha crystallin family [Verrucomicrobiae bacterium DG1235]
MTLLNINKNKEAVVKKEDESTKPIAGSARPIRTLRPKYRVEELDTSFVAEIDMPSVSKKDLEVSLVDGVLDIVGNRGWSDSKDWKSVAGDAEDGVAYRLRLAIGDEVDGDKISANLENGVLLLTLPKAEHKKPRQIAIK